MPALEYLVLADYVRQDAGMTHIMGAGIDTFYIPAVNLPAAVPVGLVARISFSSRDPVGQEHEISLLFEELGGQALLAAAQRIQTPPQSPGVPEHWRTAANVVSPRLLLPFPAHGNYRLQVAIDDDPEMTKSIDVRAIEPPGIPS